MYGARHRIARLFGLVAGLALVGMMMLTVADVVLRAVFKLPVRGTLEIVELLLACSFFVALPAVFLREEHVLVDVTGPRLRPILRRAAEAIAVVLIAVMTWQGFRAARDAIEFGDVTPDLALPRILYWIPVLAGLAAGGAAAVYMAFAQRGSR